MRRKRYGTQPESFHRQNDVSDRIFSPSPHVTQLEIRRQVSHSMKKIVAVDRFVGFVCTPAPASDSASSPFCFLTLLSLTQITTSSRRISSINCPDYVPRDPLRLKLDNEARQSLWLAARPRRFLSAMGRLVGAKRRRCSSRIRGAARVDDNFQPTYNVIINNSNCNHDDGDSEDQQAPHPRHAVSGCQADGVRRPRTRRAGGGRP